MPSASANARASLVVRFGLRGIGGVGVGVDGAELAQRQRLVSTRLLLPGQVERLTGMLPGLIDASGEEIDRAELPEVGDMTAAQARPCGDRPGAPPPGARGPRRGVPCGRTPNPGPQRWPLTRPFAGGATEGQALLEHPDGRFQVPLGEVQAAEERAGKR